MSGAGGKETSTATGEQTANGGGTAADTRLKSNLGELLTWFQANDKLPQEIGEPNQMAIPSHPFPPTHT